MIKKTWIFIPIALCAFACNKQETEKTTENNKQEQTEQKQEESSPMLISCEGIGKVKFSMNYTDLEKTYGKDKLQSDTVFAGTPMMDEERATEDRIYTTINAPEGKIYVTWAEGKTAKEIEKIGITIGDKPTYKFANGIGVGSGFNELKKANANGDFEFYGLGWQYGGMIINENATGDFFKNFPCFTTYLRTKDDTYDKVQSILGDERFKASKIGEKEGQELILSEITLVKK